MIPSLVIDHVRNGLEFLYPLFFFLDECDDDMMDY